MRVGVVSGSGTYTWRGMSAAQDATVHTPYGDVPLTLGTVNDVEVVHHARHGTGHRLLSNHLDARAVIGAFAAQGIDALVSTTVCGALDPQMTLGTLVVFDDLYFPTNRMPDGSLCTFFDRPGGADRGHWMFGTPYSEPLRRCLLDGAERLGLACIDGGCYGHVDGPRFNSRTEIAVLRACGVSAVSQTAGPEVVLAGEAGIPLVLVGYLTDYANGVRAEPTQPETLAELMTTSRESLARLLADVLPSLDGSGPAGFVYRVQP